MLNYFLMPHPPIIIPEVGKGGEGEAMETIKGCTLVGERVKDLDAETIIIISPHGAVFRNAVSIVTSNTISGDLGRFGAKEVSFDYDIDLELTNKIIEISNEKNISIAALNEDSTTMYKIPLELDHGVMVPLYYADKGKKHKLVHINYGFLSPIELLKFGVVVKEAVKECDKNVVVIASGDLSHRLTKEGPYEYSPLGKVFDKKLIDILSEGNLEELFYIDRNLIREAGECGLRSLYILAGTINTPKIHSELFSYEGPFGIGYGVFQFKEGEGNLYESIMHKKEKEHERRMEEGNPYTKLARKNLERYFTGGTLMTVDEVEDKELLNDKKGVFVSLKINGELRGCIGTIAPTTDSLGEEIIRNSISAALNDPRFQPVNKEELVDIDISVDLLYPSEPTTMDGLDPKNYGVIVTSGHKRGLLLPNLEGIDSSEEQVKIAMNKGGILPSESYTLERFKVERFKEEEYE